MAKQHYHEHVIEQINALKDFEYMQQPFSVINFGGGTPTALAPDQLEQILESLHQNFNITPDAEISIESSLMELTDDMIEVLKRQKVNRLSLGVQSFNDRLRKVYHRRGTGAFAFEKIKQLKEAGFENVGIDLIYNGPGQTLEELDADLDKIIALELAGISFYSLIIHETTPLGKCMTEQERLQMQDLNAEYTQFNHILTRLAPHGYEVLELTKLVRHQLDKYEYMRVRHSQGECLALGHGAGGNLNQYFYQSNFTKEALAADVPIGQMGRVLHPEYQIIDQFINDLQKQTVDLNAYSHYLKMDLEDKLGDSLAALVKEKLCHLEAGNLTLTTEGIFFGNNIISELVQKIIQP